MEKIVFIGGGNMASAIIGGLRRSGRNASSITVVDPGAEQRDKLAAQFGVCTLAAADSSLTDAALYVWAVKPQAFGDAAAPLRALAQAESSGSSPRALHLSVMAGIRCDALAWAAGHDNIVRAMPNTPALIGAGVTGLFARSGVDASGRALVEAVLAATGELLWVDDEADLDAVTALSGSGPAYVFYFIEAMVDAAVAMGLDAEQGRRLAVGTFRGAAELAARSHEPVSLLRERVTSKGGTTYAALTSLQADKVAQSFAAAMQAARTRAKELGDEFGAPTA